jgi:LPS O-antigen subunit length determinant protein (WzzB/FepE family)
LEQEDHGVLLDLQLVLLQYLDQLHQQVEEEVLVEMVDQDNHKQMEDQVEDQDIEVHQVV